MSTGRNLVLDAALTVRVSTDGVLVDNAQVFAIALKAKPRSLISIQGFILGAAMRYFYIGF